MEGFLHRALASLMNIFLMILQIPLDKLRVGQVLKGTVTRTMLIHGAQIDIGADFDA